MVLSKVVEDPQSGNCPNISYADVAGPVANFNPTGSPYAMSQPSFGSTTSLSSSGLFLKVIYTFRNVGFFLIFRCFTYSFERTESLFKSHLACCYRQPLFKPARVRKFKIESAQLRLLGTGDF